MPEKVEIKGPDLVTESGSFQPDLRERVNLASSVLPEEGSGIAKSPSVSPVHCTA